MTDVAAILGLPQAKVRRWLLEYWNVHFGKANQTVFSDGTGRELVTNFHTLIEFFTFYQLSDRGVTAQRILKAHKIISPSLPPNCFYPLSGSIIFDRFDVVIGSDCLR